MGRFRLFLNEDVDGGRFQRRLCRRRHVQHGVSGEAFSGCFSTETFSEEAFRWRRFRRGGILAEAFSTEAVSAAIVL